MRKTLFILILAAGLTSCGGSNSSPLGGNSVNGNFISSTVDVEQRFLYSLNLDQGSVSGFVVASEEEEAGGHDHGHAHKILAHEGHEHESEAEPEHEHEHEHGGAEVEGLPLQELDGSPFTFAGITPIGMVVDGDGRTLYLLGADGTLRANTIDGLTGLLSPRSQVATGVRNPRLLRLSEAGDAIAVLGDDLAVFSLRDDGLSPAALLASTEGWTDVRLRGNLGAGATSTGAIGFRWSAGSAISPAAAVDLPGNDRGQLAYAGQAVYVINGSDVSLSELGQAADGSLALVTTSPLPELTDPSTLVSLFDGEDLMVGDSDSVVVLHRHDGELEEEGHADLDQTPTVLFAVPDTAFVLAGHAQGEGYHLLEVTEDGPVVLGEAETEQAGVSAFGFAQRLERVIRTESL